MKKMLLAVACSAAAVSAGIAAPAAADPSHFAVPVAFSCDNGQDYSAVFRGSALWNVTLDTVSNAVLVPTSQQFNGVLTDADGNVLFETHEAPVSKGQSAGLQPNQTLCTFDFTLTQADGSTFHAWGTSTIFVTPGS